MQQDEIIKAPKPLDAALQYIFDEGFRFDYKYLT